MIKRKKLLSALLCVLLSLITAFCLVFTGCAEYKPPENEKPDVPPVTGDPSDPDTPPPAGEQKEEFSVQLIIKDNDVWQNFTAEYYDNSDGKGGAHEQGWIYWNSLKVQWTNLETKEVHTAPLNGDGKSICPDLDGDFKVTLPTVPTGFTYEPNENYVDNFSKTIEIVLYKIQQFTGTQDLLLTTNGVSEYFTASKFNVTGAYRLVLESSDDRKMCSFTADIQGTYSLRTLVDVTKNKIDPKLTVYNGNLHGGAIYHFQDKNDGGAENTYTKNILWEYYISADETKGGGALIFELYSTSLDGNASYPLVVDFIMQRDGDFTRDEYTSTPVPVKNKFDKPLPEKPEGRFTWAARNPVTPALLLDESKLILNTQEGREGKIQEVKNRLGEKVKTVEIEMGEQASLDDGYYYYYVSKEQTDDKGEITAVTITLTDRLYMALNVDNEIIFKDGPDDGGFLDSRINFKFVHYEGENYNYVEFIRTYRQHCNEEGCYPVNEELRLFAQRFAVSERLFNDGYGLAETTKLNYVNAEGRRARGNYTSDEDSMWLFLCGYYKQ